VTAEKAELVTPSDWEVGMKRLLVSIALLCAVTLAAPAAYANSITVVTGVDTAPNAYGSPAWPAFRDAAYAALLAGTFVNQAHSNNPAYVGTLSYDPLDAVVYSFGSLGNRLHEFYFVPGQTIASLTAANFQVRISYQEDGAWVDAYGPSPTWVTPTSWIETANGVFGSMGMAWWGAYGYTTDTAQSRAALADDLLWVAQHGGNIDFQIRWDTGSAETLVDPSVPEPTTLTLLGLGLVGIAAKVRRRRR
jgi:hypothetical protein